MYCRNCGNGSRFVLLVELSVVAAGVPPVFEHPDWALGVECSDCASTDVVGDPATLLVARAGQ